MNFKAYDILSSLIPGFTFLILTLYTLGIKFDGSLTLVYTAIAFLVGFVINAFSSWLEDFYYFTWGGKPSTNVLDGVSIWKVKFYNSNTIKQKLLTQTTTTNPTNDELFFVALRHCSGQKDNRIDDFNAIYSFSRALLTTAIMSGLITIYSYPCNLFYILIVVLMIFTLWLRCKQKAYYYVREVLQVYAKIYNL